MYIFVQILPIRSSVNRKVFAQRISSHCPVKYNLMLSFFYIFCIYLAQLHATGNFFFCVLNYGIEDLFDSLSVHIATMGQTILCLPPAMCVYEFYYYIQTKILEFLPF